MYRGYPEEALVSNRSSLFVYGGSDAERRAWAEEAAAHFAEEGGLTVATTAADLAMAIHRSRGVVFVPDVTVLGDEAQGIAVHVLHEQEERPKVVFGVPRSPETLMEEGRLRPDLHYSLSFAQVNLDAPGLREAIRARRARAQKKPAPTSAPRPQPTRAATRAAASRPKSRPAARAKARTASAKAKKDRGSRVKKAAARKRPVAKRRR